MSLAIDVDHVTEVLLADGWHQVLDGSFTLDAYEYLWYSAGNPDEAQILHGGGNSGVCATGFGFKSSDGWLYGPLTAIQAVKQIQDS